MDPDQPTRRLPAEPPPPQYEVADDRGWRAHVLDRLDSLRTATVVLGVLALAALGVAVYALVEATDEDPGGRGASPARVGALGDRVDDLESRVEERAGENAVSELGDRVQALEEQAEEGGDQTEDVEAVRQGVEDLQQQLTELEQRVEELESRQAEQPQP